MTAPDCIFCKIIAGEAPAAVVAEDEAVTAFMDINPVTPGHLLVVPKEHHVALATVPGTVVSHMMLTAQWLAAALRKSPIRTDGINLFFADGAAAGQEIWHAHLHVIPRWTGDGFRIKAEWGSNPGRAELEDHATLIRNAATD
jgi:histidine triad (HIT) family protein